MRRMSLLSGVIALSLSASSNSDAQKNHCSGFEVPVEVYSKLGLKALTHNLSFEPVTIGHLTLENQTGKSLKQVKLRISYLDEQGSVLFAVPYVGHFDRPDSFIFNSFLTNVWNDAIAPGEKFTLDGTNLLGAGALPRSAVVTEAHLVFSDGSSVGSLIATQPPFGDPILSELPDRFELDLPLRRLPDELRLSLSIDSRGRVVDVQFAAGTQLDEQSREKIRSQLKLWYFYPAIRHSNATAADLNVLLRFHRADIPALNPVCSLEYREKFFDKFVDVELRLDGSSRWQTWYGGHPAHGVFNGLEVRTFPASDR